LIRKIKSQRGTDPNSWNLEEEEEQTLFKHGILIKDPESEKRKYLSKGVRFAVLHIMGKGED